MSPLPLGSPVRRALTAFAVALLSVGTITAALPEHAGASPPPSPHSAPFAAGGFSAAGPYRVLDTRNGTGGVPAARVGPGQTLVLHTDPAYHPHATAVAYNVTAVNPSQQTHLTVYPASQPKPTSSSINVRAGETRANMVIVQMDANGDVAFYNNSGTVDIVADSLGFYDDGNVGGARFEAAALPKRILDTRDGTGTPKAKLGAGQTLTLNPYGAPGVNEFPNITAIAVNITVVNATAASHLTAYASGQPKPASSTINFGPGEATPNFTMVQTGQNDGDIKIYNNSGSVDVIVDYVGSYNTDFISPIDGMTFKPVAPTRIYDSRTLHAPGTPGHFGPQSTDVVQMSGIGGLPNTDMAAVVLNVTIVNPSKPTHLVMYPYTNPQQVPGVSFVNATTGQTVANSVIIPASASGHAIVYNNDGNTDVLVDVVGYILSPQKAP